MLSGHDDHISKSATRMRKTGPQTERVLRIDDPRAYVAVAVPFTLAHAAKRGPEESTTHSVLVTLAKAERHGRHSLAELV